MYVKQTCHTCNILECPLGYYGKECSEKCFPPTYGEDCQSLCNCPLKECHFVNGCVQRHLTTAEYSMFAFKMLFRVPNSFSLLIYFLHTDSSLQQS